MAYIGVSPSNGVRKKHTYTATASQTSFSGAGDEGITLAYRDSNYVDVYQNGVKLADEDYTATSGTAIVLAQGASADDIVEIIAFDVFSVADTVSKADGGTFDGNVTMAGTFTSLGIDDNATSTAITIDSAENVGIGVVPESGWSNTWGVLQVGVTGSVSAIASGSTGRTFVSDNAYNDGASQSTTWQYQIADQASQHAQKDGTHVFRVAGAGSADADITWNDAMTVDNSGNVLVGQTSQAYGSVGCSMTSSGQLGGTASGDSSLVLNRTSSDGTIAQFRKDNSAVGTIGALGGHMHVAGTACGIRFVGANQWRPVDQAGSVADNTIDIGQSNARLRVVYAGTASINTSDRNEKQDIEEITDAEKRVAVVAKGLMRKFRFIDSVEAKGDNARTHFGIIAQDLQDAFTAESLDASKYAMFCSDTWWEKEISVDAVEADEANDIEAKDAYTYMDTKDEATDGYTEKTRLGVRYSELLAFIISAI